MADTNWILQHRQKSFASFPVTGGNRALIVWSNYRLWLNWTVLHTFMQTGTCLPGLRSKFFQSLHCHCGLSVPTSLLTFFLSGWMWRGQFRKAFTAGCKILHIGRRYVAGHSPLILLHLSVTGQDVASVPSCSLGFIYMRLGYCQEYVYSWKKM